MKSKVILEGNSEIYAEQVIRDLSLFSGFKRIEIEDANGETVALKPTFNGGEIKKIKVPETWEELKELCKNICDFKSGNKGEFILVKAQDNCFWFTSYGTIEFPSLQYTFLDNLTPPLMWEFIQALLKLKEKTNESTKV